jgi:NAD-dependent SIR2 family protein deacetylase
LIVIGSSLLVAAAATVPGIAVETGARLVMINWGETPRDGVTRLRFDEAVGEVFPPAVRKLQQRIGACAG